MNPNSDARRLRMQDTQTDDAFTRTDSSPDDGSPSIVCVTTTKGTYPQVANALFWVQSQSVTGTETEGGQGNVASDGSAPFLAYNLGSAVPTQGVSRFVVKFVNYRWVFRYDG